jgi:hypothetical protein
MPAKQASKQRKKEGLRHFLEPLCTVGEAQGVQRTGEERLVLPQVSRHARLLQMGELVSILYTAENESKQA